MNCHATRAVLDLHAEGRLTPRREQAVAKHLESCPDCRSAASPSPVPSSSAAATADYKARLAAAMKSAKKTPAAEPALNLWPRDLNGVAVAAAALALVALGIGWSGAPSQKDLGGEDLAAGRIP